MKFEVDKIHPRDLKRRLPIDLIYMTRCYHCGRGRRYVGAQFVGVKRVYTWFWAAL